MDHVLEYIYEFNHSNCSNERRTELHNYLVSFQNTATNDHLRDALKSDNPELRMFLFHCIIMRPRHFTHSFGHLMDWFLSSYRDMSFGEAVLCSRSLSFLLLEYECTTLKTALSKCSESNKELFILLCSEVAAVLQQKRNEPTANRAGLFNFQNVLAEMTVEYLKAKTNSIGINEVVCAKQVLKICPRNQCSTLSSVVLSLPNIEISDSNEWIELLDELLNSCKFETLCPYFMATLEKDPNMIGCILAVFQDHIEALCESPVRSHLCSFVVECLTSCSSEILEDCVGFWEDLTSILIDSDAVESSDVTVYWNLLKLALKNELTRDSIGIVSVMAYKIIGNDLVQSLVTEFLGGMDRRIFEVILLIGPEYVGEAKELYSLVAFVYEYDKILFIRTLKFYQPSIIKDTQFCHLCCSKLVSLLANGVFVEEVLDCFQLYSGFFDDELVKSTILCSRDLEMKLAVKLARFCSKACASSSTDFKSELMQYVSVYDGRLAYLLEYLKTPEFDFEISKASSLLSKLDVLLKQSCDEDELEFCSHCVVRLAQTDHQRCAVVLGDVPRDKIPYMIFCNAESVRHFDECYNVLTIGVERNIFDENFVLLFSQVASKDFYGVMEFGLEHVLRVMDLCIARTYQPMEKIQLEAILNFYKVFFAMKRDGAEENWRQYLETLKCCDVFDNLFAASHSMSRELNEMVALFFNNVNQENPACLISWVRNSSRGSFVSWMPRCVYSKEFIDKYVNLFK